MKKTMLSSTPLPQPRKRLKALTRAAREDLPGFRLTPRDIEIVKAVSDYRALTTSQIESLFFSNQNPAARKNGRCKVRLKLLYHHGYLIRDEQPTKLSEGRKPLVYFLDKVGAEYLSTIAGYEAEQSGHEKDVSYPFLHHLLATNDIRIAIVRSVKRNTMEIPVWLDEKILKNRQMKDTIILKGENGGREKAAVVPDFYFRLETAEDRFHFFGECDLGTVTVDATGAGRRDWARKVRAYLEYYRSGAYERRYQTRDMRVLTITTSASRLTHLREITEEVGGKSRFWFTTFDALLSKDALTTPLWAVATRDGLYPLL